MEKQMPLFDDNLKHWTITPPIKKKLPLNNKELQMSAHPSSYLSIDDIITSAEEEGEELKGIDPETVCICFYLDFQPSANYCRILHEYCKNELNGSNRFIIVVRKSFRGIAGKLIPQVLDLTKLPFCPNCYVLLEFTMKQPMSAEQQTKLAQLVEEFYQTRYAIVAVGENAANCFQREDAAVQYLIQQHVKPVIGDIPQFA